MKRKLSIKVLVHTNASRFWARPAHTEENCEVFKGARSCSVNWLMVCKCGRLALRTNTPTHGERKPKRNSLQIIWERTDYASAPWTIRQPPKQTETDRMLGSMFVEWPHRGSWTELSCASCPQAIGKMPAITTLDFDCEQGRKKFPLVNDGFKNVTRSIDQKNDTCTLCLTQQTWSSIQNER